MIEIIKNIIDLTMKFINPIYNLQIDLMPDVYVKLGDLVISFLIVVLSIYLVFLGFGIIKKGDD